MGFYVYVIQSEKDGSFYRGMTVDIAQRLCAHNEGQSGYTSRKGPWKLVYYEEYFTRGEAVKRERRIKKYSRSQIKDLIESKKEL